MGEKPPTETLSLQAICRKLLVRIDQVSQPGLRLALQSRAEIRGRLLRRMNGRDGGRGLPGRRLPGRQHRCGWMGFYWVLGWRVHRTAGQHGQKQYCRDPPDGFWRVQNNVLRSTSFL
jgi:hypothetical protein